MKKQVQTSRHDMTGRLRHDIQRRYAAWKFMTVEGWLLGGGYRDVVGQELSQ
jgi:hypothetical protein